MGSGATFHWRRGADPDNERHRSSHRRSFRGSVNTAESSSSRSPSVPATRTSVTHLDSPALFASPWIHLLSIPPSTSLSISPSRYNSSFIHPSIRPSAPFIYLSISLPARHSIICQSVCLSVRPPVHPPSCLSVNLSGWRENSRWPGDIYLTVCTSNASVRQSIPSSIHPYVNSGPETP